MICIGPCCIPVSALFPLLLLLLKPVLNVLRKTPLGNERFRTVLQVERARGVFTIHP